jgi:hypothetical protein
MAGDVEHAGAQNEFSKKKKIVENLHPGFSNGKCEFFVIL